MEERLAAVFHRYETGLYIYEQETFSLKKGDVDVNQAICS